MTVSSLRGVSRRRPWTDRASLLALADATLSDLLKYWAGFGGRCEEADGLLLFAGAHAQPNPYRNGVLRLDASVDAATMLRRARAFFPDRSFAWWTREHADADLDAHARAEGFDELERIPELAMETLGPRLPLPDGVELRPATDDPTRGDYLDVVAGGWGMRGMPRETATRAFFDPASLDAPNVVAYVAYVDGHPVSGAMSFVTRRVALGCQAATVRRLPRGVRLPLPGPPGTRRGLADGCLWAALHDSFTYLGARGSVCQSSASGAPVWMRLGYEPCTSYGRYLVPA